MQYTFQYFSESLDDYLMSKAEKKALKSIVAEKKFTKRELDWLRSQIFDLARQKLSGANPLLLLDWVEEANKVLLTEPSQTQSESKVYFSPGDDCLNAILEQIAYATQSIDVCVFTISDNRISDKLVYAHNKGVKIRILTDDDKSFDEGSDIKMLARHGMEVRTDQSPNHMHHKFAIFDEKQLITGSYNWTRSASVYNQENILLTNDAEAVSRYCEGFEKLWEKMVVYEEG